MDRQKFIVFHGHLGAECNFALIALSEMQTALAQTRALDSTVRRQALDRFWTSVESFLTSTGNISKVFWPPDPRDGAMKEELKERGRELRNIFGIADDSPLANGVLRNHFEHFDERVDVWFNASQRHNVVDRSIISAGAIRGIDTSDMFRNFDPQTWTLTLMEDSLSLRPIVEGVNALLNRLAAIDPLRMQLDSQTSSSDENNPQNAQHQRRNREDSQHH